MDPTQTADTLRKALLLLEIARETAKPVRAWKALAKIRAAITSMQNELLAAERHLSTMNNEGNLQ